MPKKEKPEILGSTRPSGEIVTVWTVRFPDGTKWEYKVPSNLDDKIGIIMSHSEGRAVNFVKSRAVDKKKIYPLVNKIEVIPPNICPHCTHELVNIDEDRDACLRCGYESRSSSVRESVRRRVKACGCGMPDEHSKLSNDEIEELHGQLSEDWELTDSAPGMHNSLRRDFEFATFEEASDFLSRITSLVEETESQPDVTILDNQVTINLPSSGDLGVRDFELAKGINRITAPHCPMEELSGRTEVPVELVITASKEEKMPLRMTGRMVIDPDVDDEPWVLLEVPQGIVDSAFRYLQRNQEGEFDRNHQPAHISVIEGKEVKEIVKKEGLELDNFPGRGEIFEFELGDIVSLEPEGWEEMEKVWFIRCNSPQLEEYRKSLGLKPKLKGHEFHITIALKRQDES